MTLADIIILSILAFIVILVILRSYQKIKAGKCAGCSKSDNRPQWIQDYKKEKH